MRNLGLWVPIASLSAWALVVLAGPWLPLAPDQVDLSQILAPPPADSLLGNDDLGRPVLDRLLVGARTSCAVGLGVVALSLVLGALAALVGAGWISLMRVIDVFFAFPGILPLARAQETLTFTQYYNTMGGSGSRQRTIHLSPPRESRLLTRTLPITR